MFRRRVPVFVLAWALCGACDEPASSSKNSEQAASPETLLEWKENEAALYSVDLSTEVKSPGLDRPVAFRLEARLRATVVSKEGSQTKIALALENVHFEVPEGQQGQFEQLAPELRGPFFVTYDNGSISKEELANGTSNYAASILRTLGASLQFGPTSDRGEPWTASESDGTGRYQIRYQPVKERRYRREKKEYSPLELPRTQGQPIRKIQPTIAKSSGELSLDDGHISKVTYDEDVTLSAGKADVSSNTKLTLTLVERRASAPRIEPLESTVVLQPGAPYGSASPEDLDSKRIGTFTYETALQTLATEAKEKAARTINGKVMPGGPPANRGAFIAMTAILRTQSDKLKLAEAEVKKNVEVSSVMADALASAGTPAAQETLASLLAAPVEVKKTAATSLIRVSEPTVASEEAVRSLCNDTKFLSFCLYGLGTYARKLREAGAGERAQSIGTELLDRLKIAKSEDEKEIVLRGLANAAEPRALPLVKPLLVDESVRMRQAAVDAIRLVPGSEVDAILSERLKSDNAVSVRSAVLSSAMVREASPLIRKSIGDAAISDSNSGIRKKSLKLLVRWLPTSPEVLPIIKKVAAEDQNEAVKRLAKEALAAH